MKSRIILKLVNCRIRDFIFWCHKQVTSIKSYIPFFVRRRYYRLQTIQFDATRFVYFCQTFFWHCFVVGTNDFLFEFDTFWPFDNFSAKSKVCIIAIKLEVRAWLKQPSKFVNWLMGEFEVSFFDVTNSGSFMILVHIPFYMIWSDMVEVILGFWKIRTIFSSNTRCLKGFLRLNELLEKNAPIIH